MDKRWIVVGVLALLVVATGAGVGYLLAPKNSQVAGSQVEVINSDKMTGVNNPKVYKDIAKGKMEKNEGGIAGTHKLVREGGPGQSVYLVSSVVDLDQFVGKNVEVWGETQRVQKVSWFMDVGLVKIVE